MSLGKEEGHGAAGHTVLDWDQLPPGKGAQQPPTFQPMTVVAKWLEG